MSWLSRRGELGGWGWEETWALPRYILVYLLNKKFDWRLPWWLSDKESAFQCRRHGFNPWSRKIPHAAEQLSPAQLLSRCSRARELQLLKPMSLEPVPTRREATAMISLDPATLLCDPGQAVESHFASLYSIKQGKHHGKVMGMKKFMYLSSIFSIVI